MTGVAGLLGLIGALMLGAAIIPWFSRLKWGQTVRGAGPQQHLRKQGTPTMGGLIFVIPTALVMLWLDGGDLTAWALVMLLVGFAAIGFLDDYLKAVRRQSLGLKARQKLLFQLVVAAGFTWIMGHYLHAAGAWKLPWGGHVQPGVWFYPVAILAILGSGNAVNETDGLDGLAGGAMVIALAFFTLYAANLDRGTASRFALTLAAAVVGFLRYNLHPAKVFMGDTGSLALGGALAGLAIATRSTLLLPIVGGLFVIETLSVIIQVAAFRLFGRRVFRMSPLHHHFELVGWSEEKVVATFWLAGLIFALLAWI